MATFKSTGLCLKVQEGWWIGEKGGGWGEHDRNRVSVCTLAFSALMLWRNELDQVKVKCISQNVFILLVTWGMPDEGTGPWGRKRVTRRAHVDTCYRFQDWSLFSFVSPSSHHLLFSSYVPEALADLRGAGGRQYQWRAVEPASLGTALLVGWSRPWGRQTPVDCILLSWQATWTGCIRVEKEAFSFNYSKLPLSTIPDLVHWMLYSRLFSVVLSAILHTLSAASFSEFNDRFLTAAHLLLILHKTCQKTSFVDRVESGLRSRHSVKKLYSTESRFCFHGHSYTGFCLLLSAYGLFLWKKIQIIQMSISNEHA